MARGITATLREQAGRAGVPDIIARIKDSYSVLRPAEQAVADAVMANVKAAVDESNAEIALRAGVSQPTVTRFCRAIGCGGVRDFKLQLARSLVVGDIYLAAEPPVASDANLPPFWSSVLNEAHDALSAVERQLDPALVLLAAEGIATARHVAVLGLGGSSATLAEETRARLFRYGVGITAIEDPYLARMVAATFKPGDVFIAISQTGRTREVVEAVQIARHYGARSIAVTTPDSDLARAAEIALTTQVAEYPDTLTPSAARFAFLTIIDLLAAATGYRMGPVARENLRRIKYAVLSQRPGSVLEPLGD